CRRCHSRDIPGAAVRQREWVPLLGRRCSRQCRTFHFLLEDCDAPPIYTIRVESDAIPVRDGKTCAIRVICKRPRGRWRGALGYLQYRHLGLATCILPSSATHMIAPFPCKTPWTSLPGAASS